MSLEAMVWALYEAPTDGPLERVVLTYLADRVGSEGATGAGGLEPIAERAGVEVDAVRAAIGRMQQRELIVQTDRLWFLCVPSIVGPPLASDQGPAKKRIDPEDRAWVYARDGHACLRCGARRGLSVDHVIPESVGGPSNRTNYQTLCRPCNAWKGVRVGDEYDYRPGRGEA